MTSDTPQPSCKRDDSLAKEIAVQAELIALNFALEGRGGQEASEALQTLSRDLRQVMGSSRGGWTGLRLEP